MGARISDYGFYIVKDNYFKDFPNPQHMDNKNETRPYYLAIRSGNGILWLIPISHQVTKYQSKIRKYETDNKKCIFYYIAKFAGEDRAFLIGNAIPVSYKYIKKPFTIKNVPYILQSAADRKEILSRLKKYLSLVRQKKLNPAVDILSIEAALTKQKKE